MTPHFMRFPAVPDPGRPVAVIHGEVFDLDVAGKMKMARMECPRRLDGGEEWTTAQGYPLREGMRAGFSDGS